MSPWRWWAAEAVEAECGEWTLGDFDSREQAVARAEREYPAGTPFYVIEARSSEDRRYEGADIVPFLRSRNKERLVTAALRVRASGGKP